MLPETAALSERAGKAIMEIYSREDFGITYKDGGSPLTIADMTAHNIILKRLKEITPGLPVLSEESSAVPYQVRKSWARFWLVDPLDGTKEFIKRNGEFTVNIALIEHNRPVLGVVHAPASGITYYAGMKQGSFRQQSGKEKIKITVANYTGGTLKIVASRSHKVKAVEQFLQNIDNYECIGIGSSLKLCLIAEGSAHLYPRLGPTMEWDTAAAQCVVEEAGGVVKNINNNPLYYNKPDLHNPHFIAADPQSLTYLSQE